MTAAWVARRALGDAAEYVFASYGDAPPDVRGRRVLIVDFSYSREVLEAMNEVTKSLLVLDHHASAEKALAGLPYAVFDMERSGAGLAWEHFFPGREMIPMVAYVEDLDLWRFALPCTRQYHCSMALHPFTFEAWDEIAAQSPTAMIAEGESILKFSNQIGEKLAARAGTTSLDGVRCWSINAPVEFVGEVSEVLHRRQDKGRHLPVLVWSFDNIRGDFYCSLRSRPDGIDVSELATKFGGGGHPHAAGFRSAQPPGLLRAADSSARVRRMMNPRNY